MHDLRVLRQHERRDGHSDRAAAEQRVPGKSEEMEFEDKKGLWRTEHSAGDDRPDAEVA